MLISCPECDAGYEVPDALLRSARMMRCAACGHDWMTEPLEATASATPADDGARPSPPPAPAVRPSAAGGPVTQQISCPNCSAVYDIPAVMLASPRSMRCATCGHDWVTSPQSGEPSAPAAPPPTAPPTAPPAAAPPTPPPPTPSPPTLAPSPPAPTAEPVAARAEEEARPATAPESLPTESLPTEPVAAEPVAAEQGTTPESLSSGTPPVDELAELEAMRAAQATTQLEAAAQPGGFKDRLMGGLRANMPASIGWAATIAVLYLAARGAANHREALVQLWPPGQRIFNWLGIS